MKTESAIRRFKSEYQEYNGLSIHHAKEQVKLLREFARTLTGRELDELQPADVQGFAGSLISKGYHVNTVRKKLNMLRAFVTWAWSAGLIDAERYMKLRALKHPRGSTGRTIPDPYTRTAIREFWAALETAQPLIPATGRRSQALKRWLVGKGPWPKVRSHAMRLQVTCAVRLALDLGLRKAEIFDLSLADLHYDNAYLVVKGKRDPNTGQVKVREVPVTDAARVAIKEWVEFRSILRPTHDRPWLSLWRRDSYDHPMQPRRFETLLQDVVGPGWRWHRFRHTCATERYRCGMPIADLSRLLGHATIQQTLAYAEIAKSDIARSMENQAESFNEAVGHVAA